MESIERMNIAWMNGTNEYSVNEWNEWIERLNIPWMNGTNEWIFREWMEWMNIPCMNGTTEYSLHEWNVWIFHEWIIREWIFLVLGGPCQVQTENVLRLLLWALWISSQFFAGSVSLSLCGLCTQQLEIANSVAAFKLFVMVEKTSRRDLQILIWDISELSSQFGSQGFFLGRGIWWWVSPSALSHPLSSITLALPGSSSSRTLFFLHIPHCSLLLHKLLVAQPASSIRLKMYDCIVIPKFLIHMLPPPPPLPLAVPLGIAPLLSLAGLPTFKDLSSSCCLWRAAYQSRSFKKKQSI